MSKWTGTILGIVGTSIATAYWLYAVPEIKPTDLPDTPQAIERGAYLVKAGGCVSCHEASDGSSALAGGLALESPFGRFYAPNITPDEETGIGGWTATDFLLAMKHGRSPDGSYYFPAFPYRAYAGMNDADVLDIAAYLLSQTPVESTTPEHELPLWLSRWMMAGWNPLADLMAPVAESPADLQLARGAYLARHLGHCGECHTPRNILGIPDNAREFSGAEMMDNHIEAIDESALRDWTEEDFGFLLFLGMKPDGEYVGGEMESVIEHNTSLLTEEDRQALAAFFIRGN